MLPTPYVICRFASVDRMFAIMYAYSGLITCTFLGAVLLMSTLPARFLMTSTETGSSVRVNEQGKLVLGDEAFTPDSSRFWPADEYAPGGPQPSFDKQFVRDYCESLGWDKTYPGPELPDDVVAGTRARYVEAFEHLTGIEFDAYLADPDVVLA